MQIKWLRKALQNLESEAEYIARDDTKATQLVVYRIQLTVSLLSANPSLGHPGRLPGTHELVIPDTRYIVPYRVKLRLQQIEILRVFQSSRTTPPQALIGYGKRYPYSTLGINANTFMLRACEQATEKE